MKITSSQISNYDSYSNSFARIFTKLLKLCKETYYKPCIIASECHTVHLDNAAVTLLSTGSRITHYLLVFVACTAWILSSQYRSMTATDNQS